MANTAFGMENGSPAACNRDCAIPFPVPVAHVVCEKCAQRTNDDRVEILIKLFLFWNDCWWK